MICALPLHFKLQIVIIYWYSNPDSNSCPQQKKPPVETHKPAHKQTKRSPVHQKINITCQMINSALRGALHLRSGIKGSPNVITLVPLPRPDLFSQFKCHEISCKELGWIPNKNSLTCRDLNVFIPDKGSEVRIFKPLVCQQILEKVGITVYKMSHKSQIWLRNTRGQVEN